MLSFAPLDTAVGFAGTLLSTLATAATPLAGSNAAALAIVGLTLAVRLALTPLTYLQVRAERRQAALAPRLHELRQRHRDDPDRLRAELAALYRAEGTNPLGGCPPGLLQAPFFLVMYRLALAPPAGTQLLDATLFGVPLGRQIGDGLAGAAGPVFAGLLALLGGLAWWLSRRIRSRAHASGPGTSRTVAQLIALLPYGTLLVAAVAPLAAGIYLVTTTAWTVLEHLTLRRTPPRPQHPR